MTGSNSSALYQTEGTYLRLDVGRYRLALPAPCVLAIFHQLPAAAGAQLQPNGLAGVDLRRVFAEAAGELLPYVVAFESGGAQAAVGVDRVDHLLGIRPRLHPVPSFGLQRPELFTGALKTPDALLLLINPAALLALVQTTTADNPRPAR